MHHLRDILFRKYWIPDDTGTFYYTRETKAINGPEQKVFVASIHHLKSRLRELPPNETLSPREVLELLVPFYAYELEARLALFNHTEYRAFDLKTSKWQYRLQFSDTVSLQAGLSWKNEGHLSMALTIPPAFEKYGVIQQVAHDYCNRILNLPVASSRELERISTHTPVES